MDWKEKLKKLGETLAPGKVQQDYTDYQPTVNASQTAGISAEDMDIPRDEKIRRFKKLQDRFSDSN